MYFCFFFGFVALDHWVAIEVDYVQFEIWLDFEQKLDIQRHIIRSVWITVLRRIYWIIGLSHIFKWWVPFFDGESLVFWPRQICTEWGFKIDQLNRCVRGVKNFLVEQLKLLDLRIQPFFPIYKTIKNLPFWAIFEIFEVFGGNVFEQIVVDLAKFFFENIIVGLVIYFLLPIFQKISWCLLARGHHFWIPVQKYVWKYIFTLLLFFIFVFWDRHIWIFMIVGKTPPRKSQNAICS